MNKRHWLTLDGLPAAAFSHAELSHLAVNMITL
jgi:membrane associated rhomboid family serine protease